MTNGSLNATPFRVLLVSNQRRLVRDMASLLEVARYVVTVAYEGREAIGLIESAIFDVIISEIKMQGLDGFSLLRAIRSRGLDVPVVFLTSSPTLTTATAAMEYGAVRYLRQPIDLENLIAVVAQAATTHRLALVRQEASQHVEGNAIGDRAGPLQIRRRS